MTPEQIAPRKYRKTALVEAIQYNGQAVPGVCTGECIPGSGGYAKDAAPHIHGLEGDHSVTLGDWILTGIQGEKWACKPDIFAATYELADECAVREPQTTRCSIPPPGWYCTREPGHEGPCAAIPCKGETQTEAPRTVSVKIGTSVLTRDLVWCECGRGLSRNGKWSYCPSCGGAIDQDSYAAACELAIANGANIHTYQDSDLVNEMEGIRAENRRLVKLNLDRSREYSASPAMGTFVDLKYGNPGIVMRMLQDGTISKGKCCEVLAQLAHGVSFDEIPLPIESLSPGFDDDEIPVDVVAALRAENQRLKDVSFGFNEMARLRKTLAEQGVELERLRLSEGRIRWRKALGNPPPGNDDGRKLCWIVTADEMAYIGIRHYGYLGGDGHDTIKGWTSNGHREGSERVEYWMDLPKSPFEVATLSDPAPAAPEQANEQKGQE